jgi:hypothetical protein
MTTGTGSCEYFLGALTVTRSIRHKIVVTVVLFSLRLTCMAQLQADQFPGSDIGEKINACVARFSPTSPGVCMLSSGQTYVLTTTIVKPQWVTIEGNNSVISVCTGQERCMHPAPAVVAATTIPLIPTYPGTYSRGGIRNLTLIGNGVASTPYGIWLGGDPTGTIVSTKATDFLEVFDNVHVQNFANQYVAGNNVFEETWIGGSIMGGYPGPENGLTCASSLGGERAGTSISGMENMAFLGTHFPSGGGNTGLAIKCYNSSGSTISLIAASIDYWGSNNRGGCPDRLGTGQVLFNNGHLVVSGSTHMETCSGPEIVANGPGGTFITIGPGAEFTLVDQTHSLSTPALVLVGGSNPHVNLAAGALISIGRKQTLDAVIANSGTGGQFYCGPYEVMRGGNYQVPCRSGAWNAGMEASYANGSMYGFNVEGNGGLTATGNVQALGIACSAANVKLGKAWGTGAIARSFIGYSQSCQFTIATGTSSFAPAPTVTFTFPIPFSVTPVCTLDVHGITGNGGGIMFSNTMQSATAPAFTASTANGSSFQPAPGESYTAVLRCGP